MRLRTRSTASVLAIAAILAGGARAEDLNESAGEPTAADADAAESDSGEVGGLLGIFFPKTEDTPSEAATAAEPAPPDGAEEASVAAPAGETPLPAADAPDESPSESADVAPAPAEEAAAPVESADAARDDAGAPTDQSPPPVVTAPAPEASEVPVLGVEPEAAPPPVAVTEEPPAAREEASPVTPPPSARDEKAGITPPGTLRKPEAVTLPAPSATPDLDADLRASRRPAPEPPADPGAIQLPTEEIYGEIEKPDIFFLLPKARSKSDEQLIRSRIQREITRPLIKDWLEEELLLK